MTPAAASAREQLERLCLLAAELPGEVSVQLAGDEELLHAVSRYQEARAYGMVAFEEDAEPRVWWSAAVQLDRVHLTAAICRRATPAEVAAVEHWELTGTGRTGVLHKLVEEG
jgi:hypothetical protein